MLTVYIVNLKRRSDRRARIAAHLPIDVQQVYTSDWDAPFDWQDLDVHNLPEGTALFSWQRKGDSNPWWNRPLKLGEIGCALAHTYCWRAIAASGRKHALVIEDDAIVPQTLDKDVEHVVNEVSAIDSDWHLIYLGRVRLADDVPVDGHIVRPGYSHCTYGYLLSASGAAMLSQSNFESCIMPVDEYLPSTYIQHPRDDVSAIITPFIRAYGLREDLVMQQPKDEAGSDTESSPFVTTTSGSP